MQEWRKAEWQKWPRPIIQTFYLQTPGNAPKPPSDVSSVLDSRNIRAMVSEDVGELKNLQRIQIDSEYLHHELLHIASVLALPNPIV